MGKEHNELGQLIIYDVETGIPIKFNEKEYDRFLDMLWIHKGIKPNTNFSYSDCE